MQTGLRPSACAAAHSTGRDPKNAPPTGALTGHRTVREMRDPLGSILAFCN
jgi:hypothetical protein